MDDPYATNERDEIEAVQGIVDGVVRDFLTERFPHAGEIDVEDLSGRIARALVPVGDGLDAHLARRDAAARAMRLAGIPGSTP